MVCGTWKVNPVPWDLVVVVVVVVVGGGGGGNIMNSWVRTETAAVLGVFIHAYIHTYIQHGDTIDCSNRICLISGTVRGVYL